MSINVRFQVAGHPAADWTAANPVLLDRELAFETDTGRSKIGDGATAWNSLDYLDAAIDVARTWSTLQTFVDKIRLEKSGTPTPSPTRWVIQADVEPDNTNNTALFIYPESNITPRVYFGLPTRRIYSLDFSNVDTLAGVPAFSTADAMHHGYAAGSSHAISRPPASVTLEFQSSGPGANFEWAGGSSYTDRVLKMTLDADTGDLDLLGVASVADLVLTGAPYDPPTVTLGANAGAGATIAHAYSGNGRGTITIVGGTGSALGPMAVITFAGAFPNRSTCVMTGGNQNGVIFNKNGWATCAAGSATLEASLLTNGATYIIHYSFRGS